jgi:hypothetical protein
MHPEKFLANIQNVHIPCDKMHPEKFLAKDCFQKNLQVVRKLVFLPRLFWVHFVANVSKRFWNQREKYKFCDVHVDLFLANKFCTLFSDI